MESKPKEEKNEGGCRLLDMMAFNAIDFAKTSILQFNFDSKDRNCICESS